MVGQQFKQEAFIQQFLGLQRHWAELSLVCESSLFSFFQAGSQAQLCEGPQGDLR